MNDLMQTTWASKPQAVRLVLDMMSVEAEPSPIPDLQGRMYLCIRNNVYAYVHTHM